MSVHIISTDPVPTISVSLCNFNHASYIRQCLAGLLRQSFRDFEIVLVDDGSTDDSRKIIEDMAARDKRIKPHFFDKNQGLMAALGYAMSQIRGRFYYGEASDDFIVDEHFFEIAMREHAKFPDSAGVYAMTALLSAERNQLTCAMGIAPHEGYLKPAEFFTGFLKGHVFVPGSSAIWRRDFMSQLGDYDYRLGPQVDYLVNHALPCHHGVVYVRKAVKCMRVFEQKTNYSSKTSLWQSAERYALVEQELRKIGLSYPDCESDWCDWRARSMWDMIEKSGARLQRK